MNKKYYGGRKHELSQMLHNIAINEPSFIMPIERAEMLELGKILADNDVATLDELKERLKK